MCKAESCDRQAVAQGFCINHYKQAQRRGEIQKVIKPKSGTCEVDGCSGNVYADGKCSKHYRREQRKGVSEECSVEGCENPHLALGFCRKHYQEFKAHGMVNRPPKPKKEKVKKVRKSRVRECVECGEVTKIYGNDKCRSCYRKQEDVKFQRVCHNHTRRAKIKATAEKFTKQQVLDKTNGNCGICGKYIDLTLKRPDMNSFSVDHILPLSKNGSHTLDNVQAAHLLCNCLKQAKLG